MMLEGKSYLVPRSLLSSCKTETQWAYLAHEVLGGKRLAATVYLCNLSSPTCHYYVNVICTSPTSTRDCLGEWSE
jgi:hypothetical protein